MLLVLVKAIPSLTVGRQRHPMDEKTLHGSIIFHVCDLALTDITKFSHVAPSLSKDATDEDSNNNRRMNLLSPLSYQIIWYYKMCRP